MKEIYNKMGEFSIQFLGDATPREHLLKMKNEADEAMDALDDIFEYADCLLALYAAAYKSGFTFKELRDASDKKIEIIKLRKWEKIDDGTYQHV